MKLKTIVVTLQIEADFASGAIDPATFNPTPFERGTPEYEMAMIKFLIKMQQRGHRVQEQEINKVSDDMRNFCLHMGLLNLCSIAIRAVVCAFFIFCRGRSIVLNLYR